MTEFDATNDEERRSRGMAMDHQLNDVGRALVTLELEIETAINNLKKARVSDHDPRLLVGDFVAYVRQFFDDMAQQHQYFEPSMVGELAGGFMRVDLSSKSPTNGLQPLLLAMKRIGTWAEEESTISNAMRRSFTGIYQQAHALYNQIASLETRMENELIGICQPC